MFADATAAVTAAPDAAELLNALDFLLDVAELHMPNYSSSDNIARALDLRKRLSGEGESQEK
jgi:hypothetical protein